VAFKYGDQAIFLKSSLFSLQQGCYLAAQRGQLRFDNVPHDEVVYVGVSMGQDVAEGDDTAVFANPGRVSFVEAGKPCERLAGYLELPLDGRAQGALLVVGERLPRREAYNQLRGLLDVIEVLLPQAA
jgi:hypothetical protein